MAQANLSLDQARNLGLFSYIAFIKTKAEQQLTGAEFNIHFDSNAYHSLFLAVDELILHITERMEGSGNKELMAHINSFLQDNGSMDSYQAKFWEINEALTNIHNQAQAIIMDPTLIFSNKIAAIQSLGALNSICHLIEDRLQSHSTGDRLFLSELNKLQLKHIYRTERVHLSVA